VQQFHYGERVTITDLATGERVVLGSAAAAPSSSLGL
jgi:hypothetical protein